MIKKLLMIALFFPFFMHAAELEKLERQVQKELGMLNYPTPPWRAPDDPICDVAIIGGGMAGTALAHALKIEGIYNVQIFDACEEGKEGPWLTSARMRHLRSGKTLRGPALGIPHLTARAWYEATYGKKAWKRIGKIPTQHWGNYLQWLQKTLKVSVNNGYRLEKILPNPDNSLNLHFEGGRIVHTRKVVLATGRGGFGGAEIPSFAHSIPKKFWAHTSELIDPAFFSGKRICVVGVGASGFDAAATALENEARSVQMLMRRSHLPTVNHFAALTYRGFQRGYFFLSDKERSEIFCRALEGGIPPPVESLKRLDPFPSFELLSSIQIESFKAIDDVVHIQTNQGELLADFLVLATGYAVDGAKQKELSFFHDKILLWKDREACLTPKLSRFAYLGPYFEFLENSPGIAPYLENIHCFNYGAFLSHGRISGDIDAIDIGINRLAEGIAIKLFLSDKGQSDTPVCPGSCQLGLPGGD